MHRRSNLPIICLVLWTLLGAKFVLAEDVVVTRAAKGGEVPRKGTIVQWEGNDLTLDINGRQRTIKGESILRIETKWTAEYLKAEELFQARRFSEALASYQAALQTEPRVWAQNMVLARMVQCASLQENHAAACQLFAKILQTDPQTRFMNLMPLPWLGSFVDRGLESNCRQWIRANDPALKLMGASWLLGTAARSESEQALTQLSQDLSPSVANLAKAQLWRGKVIAARDRDLVRLESQLTRMPKSLQAPALLLLSDMQNRLGQKEESILNLMKIPILHSDDLKLSAAALLKAGSAIKKAGNSDDAARLFREIQRDYGGSRFANEAKAHLQEIQNSQ